MKGSKLVLVCLLLVAVAIVASAIIASARPGVPGFIVYTQRDGSKLTLSMFGSNEYMRIGHTVDNLTIIPDDNGTYYYATLDKKGNLVRTNVKANDMWKRGKAEKAFTAQLAKGLDYSAEQKKAKMPQPAAFPPPSGWAYGMHTYTGTVKVLVIKMYFKNYNWTLSQTTLNNALTQTGYQSPIAGQTGCFKDYMTAMTGGLMTFTFGYAGPYKASRNWSYYGHNINGGDGHNGALADEALVKADPDVNFALYDNDNDSRVDPFILIHAGYDECEGADTDWSYVSTNTLANDYPWGLPPRVVDGKYANGFFIMSEYRGTGGGSDISSIANYCHEYMHCMGGPETNYVNYSMLCWCQQAYGSWAGGDGDEPTAYCAGIRYGYGWNTPTVLSSAATNLTLVDRNSDPTVSYKINSNNGEYFMLENVKATGWDAFCRNSGLLISHIDPDVWPWSQLEPADNVNSCGASEEAGDVFPGTGSKTSFTDTTTPSMKDTTGGNTGKPITNISYDGSYVVHFDFMQ